MVDATTFSISAQACMMNKNTEQISAAGGEWLIELLRGVAALMVVLAHYWDIAGIQPGIFIFLHSGVDLFFVISGFVFAPYLFEKNFSAGSFFIRRLFRIYPLYIISLLVYMALKIADGQEASHFISHLMFLHTTESREVAFYYNPAYWSLPPEVEFYIFFPALLLIAKLKRGFTLVVVSAFVLHCFLAFLSPLDIKVVSLPAALNVHLPGLLIEFLLGAIAWQISGIRLARATRCLFFFVGVVTWIGSACLFFFYFRQGGDNAVIANDVLRGNVGLFAAFSFMFIVAALGRFDYLPPSWLKRLSIRLGNLSFGVYLFHNAAPQILRLSGLQASQLVFAAACFVLTVLIAQAMYEWLENPMRNYGRELARNLDGGRDRV